MIRILVPLNFTDYSLNAINTALGLSQRTEAELTLLHCFQKPEIDSDEIRVSSAVADETISTESDFYNKLETISAQFFSKHKQSGTSSFNINCKVIKGFPEDLIPAFSNEEGYDLIVMGTKTKGELIKAALGSITNDIIKASTATVLTVPDGIQLVSEKTNKILFLIESAPEDKESLKRLLEISAPFKVDITAVLHRPLRADKNDIRKMDELRRYCEANFPDREIAYEIITGKSFVKSIESYITENPTDLIAMTRRKRKGLLKLFKQSVTGRFLFGINAPLLIFHS